MALTTVLLTNMGFTVNSVDLSDHVIGGRLAMEADDVPNTTMGQGVKTTQAGLPKWECEMKLAQNYASAKTDATLFTLIGSATLFTVIAIGNASSGTNNTYTMTNMRISGGYNMIDGEIEGGKISDVTVKFTPGRGSTMTKS